MSKLMIYQTLHMFGVMMVFAAYGALIARVWMGSTAVGLRKFGAIVSGVGLLLILVSGFGMQPVHGWPLWILVKVAVWLSLGVMIVMINRKALPAPGLFLVTLLLGLVAIVMAYMRPT